MRRVVSRILPSASIFLPRDSSDRGPPSSSSARLSSAAIDDFYMQLDSPHASWAPGDEISGRIIVSSKRNIANIVITLSLIGHVKINSSASYSKLRPVLKTLFNHTVQIYGPSHEVSDLNELVNGLNVGEHRFPFVVKLPTKRVFTSLDFGKGSISYVLRACMGNASSYVSSPTLLSQSNASSPLESSCASVTSPAGPGAGPGQGARALKTPTLRNPLFTAERLITLICPIDVSKLAPATAKRLILRNNRSKALLRTQSGNSSLYLNTADGDERLAASILGDAATDTCHVITRTQSNQSATTAFAPAPSSSAISTPSTGSHVNSSLTHLAPNALINRQATVSPPPTNHILVCLEIPQKGYLRGELLPIQCTIKHIRQIHDLNGVIITLVRVCRIASDSDGGPDIFRKDLQQLILPMYIDPVSLELQVRTSLRVPADAFPTIAGCPLVSFSYFVEVLINLSGKLIAIESKAGGPDLDFGISSLATLNSALSELKARQGFINTDRLKRLRKFLQLSTEVVIGTHRLDLPAASTSPKLASPLSVGEAPPSAVPMASYPEADSPGYDERPAYLQTISPRNAPVALMEMPREQVLTEKERIRAYETSLMPSAPPDIDGFDRAPGAGACMPEPSALPHGATNIPQAVTSLTIERYQPEHDNLEQSEQQNNEQPEQPIPLEVEDHTSPGLPVSEQSDFQFFLQSDPSDVEFVPQYFASGVANSERIHT